MNSDHEQTDDTQMHVTDESEVVHDNSERNPPDPDPIDNVVDNVTTRRNRHRSVEGEAYNATSPEHVEEGREREQASPQFSRDNSPIRDKTRKRKQGLSNSLNRKSKKKKRSSSSSSSSSTSSSSSDSSSSFSSSSSSDEKSEKKKQIAEKLCCYINRVSRVKRTVDTVLGKIVYIERSWRKAHDWANCTGQGVEDKEQFEDVVKRRCRLYYTLLDVM